MPIFCCLSSGSQILEATHIFMPHALLRRTFHNTAAYFFKATNRISAYSHAKTKSYIRKQNRGCDYPVIFCHTAQSFQQSDILLPLSYSVDYK